MISENRPIRESEISKPILVRKDETVRMRFSSGGMNVIYRRPDGNIGWIDPSTARSVQG